MGIYDYWYIFWFQVSGVSTANGMKSGQSNRKRNSSFI